MKDLLIAGGGPAGLATAILAAERGMEVVVVEPRPGVLDKACGEGLMPPGVASLAAMGVEMPISWPFCGIRYLAGGRTAQGDFPWGRGLGIRRTVLHKALLDRARALGVVPEEGKVGEIDQREDHVRAAGHRARWLVAADGLHSSIARGLGVELPPRRPPRYGIRRHFAVPPWSDRVEVYWAADCEAYVTPLAPYLVGVAVLFSGRGSFESWMGRFPALAERLGQPCTAPMGGGPFERRIRRRSAGRIFLAGDAAGFLDPITGEGVQLAFAAASLLVRCLSEGRPGAYERGWRRLARRYWWLTSALLALRRLGPARRRMVPILAANPALFHLALKLLAGAPRHDRALHATPELP